MRTAPSLCLELRPLSRDREQHLSVGRLCKIPTDDSCSEMLYKLDSCFASLAPLFNTPSQDFGSEIVEHFEKMELGSDPDLNFLGVVSLPFVCIWMSHRI